MDVSQDLETSLKRFEVLTMIIMNYIYSEYGIYNFYKQKDKLLTHST